MNKDIFKKLYDIKKTVMKRYRKITLGFLIYALVFGYFLANFFYDSRNYTIITGFWVYGYTLFVGGVIFFFINMFVKRFGIRLMWFSLLVIPQYIFGALFVGSSWGLFGEQSYMYKFTPLGMALFFGTEIFYLYLMRRNMNTDEE